ncbi:glycoside hydrolase family protein [Breoghania sp.]|uniref:glycoside hydrolase family protein n=1 Tax=Breoghania sp. TaxID=2065378 RepID=UPI0029C9CFD4|nr:peptidoglycan-binding protein [Breoghania sp.]
MTVITKLSPAGAADLGAHEGFVSRTYRCPAGKLTIGFGFTMSSSVFASYWKRKHGRSLKPGDTISREEAEKLLIDLVNYEYGVTVVDKIKPSKQHHFDGAGSVCFNLGPRAAGWKWAKALAANDPRRSAMLLRKTGVTASGRRLPGLVKRREAEARMIEHGIYSTYKAIRVEPSASVPLAAPADEELKHYQQILTRIGHYKGQIDGLPGPRTSAAVRAFQRTQPNLNVDGILGTATAAALDRAQAASDGGGTATIGAVLSTAGTAAAATSDAPEWVLWVGGGAAALAIVTGVYLAWTYRDEVRAAIKRGVTK